MHDLRAVRLQKIKNIVERDGVVSISDLSKGFDKTPITIRRDLLLLEEEGLVRRTYGGAILVTSRKDESGNIEEPDPYDIRETEHLDEKMAIAEAAAKLIKDGDSLILNAGTTVHELAILLKKRRELQIVTNGLTVASALVGCVDSNILMIGGEVDFKKMGTVGPVAEDSLENIHVSKAFLGVTGISVTRGITMHSQTEARINAKFVQSADEVTVLVDSSKFEAHSLFKISDLSSLDRIITDSGITDKTREALEASGVELIVVDCN